MVSNSDQIGVSKMTGEVLDIIGKIQSTVTNIANSDAAVGTYQVQPVDTSLTKCLPLFLFFSSSSPDGGRRSIKA